MAEWINCAAIRFPMLGKMEAEQALSRSIDAKSPSHSSSVLSKNFLWFLSCGAPLISLTARTRCEPLEAVVLGFLFPEGVRYGLNRLLVHDHI
jgi:hypothetical protein